MSFTCSSKSVSGSNFILKLGLDPNRSFHSTHWDEAAVLKCPHLQTVSYNWQILYCINFWHSHLNLQNFHSHFYSFHCVYLFLFFHRWLRDFCCRFTSWKPQASNSLTYAQNTNKHEPTCFLLDKRLIFNTYLTLRSNRPSAIKQSIYKW